MIKTTASNLPRGWQIDNISNLTNNLDNRRIPLNQEQRSEKEGKGSYPYVGANNIVGYIDEYIFDEKILCIAEDGGSWGFNETCAFIMNEKCWVNNHAHVLTPKANLVLEYLKYYLNYADLNLYINGATRGKLNQSALNKIEVPIPPLAEQQKIAAILDAADSLRQKDQQLVERYSALSQSLFLEMFGDPVTNPMGWAKVELGSLAKISSGSTPSRDIPENYLGNIPWVKTGEVNGARITHTSESISEEALANSSCKLYPSGSLIIAMYGQGKTRGQVGILGIEAATNQACAVIPPSSKMNYDFLFTLLKLSYEDLRNLGRGGNQPNLNSGLIKAYCVISPPITLQIQFAERIQLIEAQKQQAQLSLEKSEALFNSLLQRAFTGELTVKIAA